MEKKKIFMIGIKGVGMTGLAQILKSHGHEVLGSDLSEKFFTDKILENEGIVIIESFEKKILPEDIDLAIHSTAYKKETNQQLAFFVESGVSVKSYPEMVAELFNDRFGIAVAGSHGKTTTTTMLAFLLKELGEDPQALIGAPVDQFGGNALIGQSDYFVLEADEYQNKLLSYKPKAAIITNVDWDHPDFFKTKEENFEVFKTFINNLDETVKLVLNKDSKELMNLVTDKVTSQVMTYGEDSEAEIRFEIKEQGKFLLYRNNDFFGEFNLSLPGKHNVSNMVSAIALIFSLGLDVNKELLQKAVLKFKGPQRRLENKGEYEGVLWIDDYAHHPEEIMKSLEGVKDFYPQKNLITVFKPHTFTRTATFLKEFAASFKHSDKVLILDIYGSAREEQGGVHAEDLVSEMKKLGVGVVYTPSTQKAVEYLKENLKEEDIVLTMGAGDAWKVGEELFK